MAHAKEQYHLTCGSCFSVCLAFGRSHSMLLPRFRACLREDANARSHVAITAEGCKTTQTVCRKEPGALAATMRQFLKAYTTKCRAGLCLCGDILPDGKLHSERAIHVAQPSRGSGARPRCPPCGVPRAYIDVTVRYSLPAGGPRLAAAANRDGAVAA